MLAQPEYTARFEKELADRKIRVPLTKDGKLFLKVAEFGEELIWLHTYGERMTAKNRPKSWTHEFTKELLELLWVLEKTIAGYPEQKKLLEEVLAGELFRADELPLVPDDARKAPKPSRGDLDFHDE